MTREAVKLEYISKLIQMISMVLVPDAELYCRIERLLGIADDDD